MRVGHLQVARLAAQLLDGANRSLHHLRIGARVAEGHRSSVGGDRMAPVDGDVTVGNEWSTLAVAAESESFELADDLEGERIVEFQHVHVVRPHPGAAERALGRAPSDHAVNVIAASTDEVECGRVLIRRAVEVRAAAQHVDRPARDVYLG